MIILLPTKSMAGNFGDVFAQVLGEVIFRSLLHSTFESSWGAGNFGHNNTGSTANSISKQRPRALSEKGKLVNFLFSVKFVFDTKDLSKCTLQKTVHHRSYFPWLVKYPKKQYMDLWFNNQSIKELAKKNLSNVVHIKGQKSDPLIRTKQEADLYSCPKLKKIPLENCKWIKSDKIKLENKNHDASKQATVRMMNKVAELGGNNIAFITRTGKSSMGMQKFSYEVFKCN